MSAARSVYILLGSNLQQPIKQLKRASRLIEKHLSRIVKKSSIYETQPWGNDKEQPLFLNQIIKLYSRRTALTILRILQRIEIEMGKVQLYRWGPRIIDIDILFIGHEIISNIDLIVPHSKIQERLFTLIPLSEIAPKLIHPVLLLNPDQMISQCQDKLVVKRISK